MYCASYEGRYFLVPESKLGSGLCLGTAGVRIVISPCYQIEMRYDNHIYFMSNIVCVCVFVCVEGMLFHFKKSMISLRVRKMQNSLS